MVDSTTLVDASVKVVNCGGGELVSVGAGGVFVGGSVVLDPVSPLPPSLDVEVGGGGGEVGGEDGGVVVGEVGGAVVGGGEVTGGDDGGGVVVLVGEEVGEEVSSVGGSGGVGSAAGEEGLGSVR